MASLADQVTAGLGAEIDDVDEETFLLYAQPAASRDLGFVDVKATSVQVAVHGRDFTIHQSPSVLSSTRAGGTTGAVLWRITPLFAEWISSPASFLLRHALLSASSSVLELGCGISPLNALALAPRVARYVLTDQPYVQRFVRQNLAENEPPAPRPRSGKGRRAEAAAIHFSPLDWETDEVTRSLTGTNDCTSFDAVVACDCVFNYALVQPFVQTCVDVCRLRLADLDGGDGDAASRALRPCLCIVAQQLRNEDVFQLWLSKFSEAFRVWRIPETELPPELRPEAGFVVHVGILRET